ncbi:MAG TPA: hypothetical protein VMT29_21935 [Steroidobacteraceae bacterium]|nr:hypothetical protein [Steroidobacteraceae bacterium]
MHPKIIRAGRALSTRRVVQVMLAASLVGSPVAPAVDATASGVAPGSLPGATSSDPARAGIWKAVVPPTGSMQGEFDGNDPIGLSAGVLVPADCSINWVDPDTRKLYCFSSATSLVFFQTAPHTYLEQARRSWRSLGRAAR